MRAKLPLAALTAALLLSGCSGSDNIPRTSPPASSSAISADYQGIWRAPGYAMTMVVGTNSIDLYQHTSDYCLHTVEENDVTTEDLEGIVHKTDDENQLEWYLSYGTASFSAPGKHFERQTALPTACHSNLISLVDDSSPSLDSTDLWDFYGQIFAQHYLDFDAKNVDWQQVLNDAGAQLHTGSSPESLFEAMAQTLVPLADTHNYVQTQQGWSAKTLTKPTLIQLLVEEYALENGLPFPIPDHVLTAAKVNEINAFVTAHLQSQWELVADYAAQPSDIKAEANGLIRWFDNQGVGYLFIGGMTGYANAEELDGVAYAEQTLARLNAVLDQALTDLQHVNGLIVDVRTNDGGHDFVSLAIASRFTDSTRHVYSKQAREGQGRTPIREVYLTPHTGVQYTGPVVLLTSASTVSAAETFTLAMSQLPMVTLIGEPSHGAFSDVMEWTLPNGFSIGLSNEFYLSPQGEWYEGQGIPVDITVPFYTPEQRDAGIDLGIETAFAQLTQ